MVQSVGVDGCPGGWVAVELGDGHFSRAAFCPSFAEILTLVPEATAVGVDVPIGLPESGPRAADTAARAFVGARRSSVFTTPTRLLLETEWRPGLGITRQSHGLGQRIFEIERAIDRGRMQTESTKFIPKSRSLQWQADHSPTRRHPGMVSRSGDNCSGRARLISQIACLPSASFRRRTYSTPPPRHGRPTVSPLR